MAENSNIEWTQSTFNPWRGCQKVSEGCARCYAETMSGRNPKTLGIWGPNGTRVVASETMWREPLKWDRKAKEAGERHRVFCASLADIFEDWQGVMVDSQGSRLINHFALGWRPFSGTQEHADETDNWLTMQDVRRRLFELIDETPNLNWLLLTKRPENIAKMMPTAKEVGSNYHVKGYLGGLRVDVYRPNVWIGTSVEGREQKKRINILRTIPAAIRFLSVEPLLEDLGELDLTGISWVIVGGESGHGARPMHPEWVRSIRDQCKVAGCPFFFKQWGEWAPLEQHHVMVPGGNYAHLPSGDRVLNTDPRRRHIWPARQIDNEDSFSALRVGKKTSGRMLDGQTWSEFPSVKAAT